MYADFTNHNLSRLYFRYPPNTSLTMAENTTYMSENDHQQPSSNTSLPSTSGTMVRPKEVCVMTVVMFIWLWACVLFYIRYSMLGHPYIGTLACILSIMVRIPTPFSSLEVGLGHPDFPKTFLRITNCSFFQFCHVF